MGTQSDELRREIELTRSELTTDVDALADKVTPGKVVERRVERAKGRFASIKDKVMGAKDDALGTLHDKTSSATGSASDTKDSLAGTAQAAPGAIKDKAEGNPLAAGLIAFGVGWLASALVPASQKEEQAASRLVSTVKENAEPLKAKAQEAVDELKENLREPAQQAAQSLKESATGAAQSVQQEAKSSATDVASDAKSAGQHVRSESGAGSSY